MRGEAKVSAIFPEIEIVVLGKIQSTNRRIHISQLFSNLTIHRTQWEGLLKHRSLGPTSRVSISLGMLKWGQIICVSIKFPDAAYLVTNLCNEWSWREEGKKKR